MIVPQATFLHNARGDLIEILLDGRPFPYWLVSGRPVAIEEAEAGHNVTVTFHVREVIIHEPERSPLSGTRMFFPVTVGDTPVTDKKTICHP